MKTQSWAMCLLAFGFLAAASARAEEGPVPERPRDSVERRFRQLDKDGDGRVTAAEMGNADLHRRLDRDGDGAVTLEEAREALAARRAERDLPSAPPATVPEGIDVNARPGPPPAVPPFSRSASFANLAFATDYLPGTRDVSGRLMSGTETMRFLRHGGRLFASTGCWMDLPYGPRAEGKPAWTGPQVLVKDSAAGPWRVDVTFPDAVRVDAMISATFVTDGSGRELDPPVNLLVASPSSESTATWTRDDATGTWTETVAAEGLRGGLRSFCTHRDSRTGVQHLFGGSTKSGCIFRAVYDPEALGKLRWDKQPELSGTGRMMCMAEADGVLYAAAGIEDETPLSGGLFRRVDGEKPRWELLWRWPHLIKERGDETEILRGLTAIPDPAGGGHQVLLGTCNYPGVVYRIDPKRSFAVTIELDIRAYFASAFGVAELRGPCLSAYNDFLPAVDPDTGERLHLLGLWINHPDGRTTENGASAWYLVRHADGTYAHGRVFDPQQARPNPPRGLLATRTIEISPFPEDEGRVLYWGGFDCAGIASRDTAWIYRGVVPATEPGPGGPARAAERDAEDLSAAGPLTVETIEFPDLKDARRSDRALPIKVHIGKEGGPYPVVVLSHGGGGNWDANFAQARHLASHGFAVLCTEHPGSNTEVLRRGWRFGENLEAMTRDSTEVLGRPRDVSFAIDRAAEWNRAHETLRGRLDLEHLAVMGHSYGAYTALVVCGARPALDWLTPAVAPGQGLAPDLSDPRVDCGVALSPQGPVAPFFVEGSFASIAKPLLGVTGSLDTVQGGLPAESRRRGFELWPPRGKVFVWLANADHLAFSDPTGSGRIGLPSPSRADAQPVTRAATLLFLRGHLKQDAGALQRLTVQTLRPYCRGRIGDLEVLAK